MKKAKTQLQRKQRGILYVRVSDPKQIDGTSLDGQEREGKKYFEDNNIELVKIYREEGVSAKTAKRKEFLKAIEFCRRYKKTNPVDVFVVYRVNRFARNAQDHLVVKSKLKSFGTNLVSITEPLDDTPAGKMLEIMLAAFAEFDNEVRSQGAIDGLSDKINEGLWPFWPFVGYISSQCKKRGLKKIEPDRKHPDIFPLIQKGLKRFANNIYRGNQKALERDLIDWGIESFLGKKLDYKFVYRILNDRHLLFYAGFLPNFFTDEIVPGIHEKMITVEEMQQIKFYRDVHRVQPSEKTVFSDKFPLRQFVCCGDCGKGLTGSTSKGRTKKYDYYHCHNRACKEYGKTIPVKALHKSFRDELKSIVPDKKFLTLIKKAFLKRWESQVALYQKALKKQEQEIEKLKGKLERIYDDYTDGLFSSKEAYLNKKEKLENELVAAKIEHNENNIDELNYKLAIEKATEYTRSLVNMWEDLVRPHNRQKMLAFVFPGGIQYVRTTGSWNHGLGYLFKYYKDEKESGKNNSEISLEVPHTGFAWNLLMENIRVFASNYDCQSSISALPIVSH